MIKNRLIKQIGLSTCLAFLVFGFAQPTFAQKKPAMQIAPLTYPDTKRGNSVDTAFGILVADPYRWLENPASTDKAVAGWVTAQNKVTNDYLATLPGRAVFRERLAALFAYDRVSSPFKRGNLYFYTRNSGVENQGALYVRTGVEGAERLLIDPNTWSEDGATAPGEWMPSEDGAYIAYGVHEGGSDLLTIHVLNVASGEVMDDAVERVRFTSIEWARDGTGFFYARFADAAEGASAQATIAGHSIYFHALGTAQSTDRLVYATPDQPNLLHTFSITEDGHYLAIASTPDTKTNSLTLVDLTQAAWPTIPIITEFTGQWGAIGNVGTTFYIMTDKDADRRRIVTYDIADPNAGFGDLIPQQDNVMNDGWMVGGMLLISYLDNATIKIGRYALDGTPDGEVKLPGIGSAVGFRGDPKDKEAFFIFTTYNVPITVYRYDVAANSQTVWADPGVAINLDQFVVEQRFFTSKDGTKVPMFLLRRRDVTGPAPTMLYAYGGFGISMIPGYSPPQLAWVEQGGVLAVANIRGGGEFGGAWHDAGRRLKKQNVFDDFIAAGEYLIAEGITPADGLAIHGESNGGLLIGAVVNQRPDLFAAALAGVGVMDMLRYNQFTSGQLSVDEYGDPAVEIDFRNLLSYSPYHNIKPGQDYPAILATTADTDDRVVPAHTFKYVAALQAAHLGPMPRLARIETRAGHGAGKPTDKAIAEVADLWAFAAQWTGLDVRPVGGE